MGGWWLMISLKEKDLQQPQMWIPPTVSSETTRHCALTLQHQEYFWKVLKTTRSVFQSLASLRNFRETLSHKPWKHLRKTNYTHNYSKVFVITKTTATSLYNRSLPETLTWTKQIKTKIKQENPCHTLPCLKAPTDCTVIPANQEPQMLYFQKLNIFRASNRADTESRLTFALLNFLCYVCPCRGKLPESKTRRPKKGKCSVVK